MRLRAPATSSPLSSATTKSTRSPIRSPIKWKKSRVRYAWPHLAKTTFLITHNRNFYLCEVDVSYEHVSKGLANNWFNFFYHCTLWLKKLRKAHLKLNKEGNRDLLLVCRVSVEFIKCIPMIRLPVHKFSTVKTHQFQHHMMSEICSPGEQLHLNITMFELLLDKWRHHQRPPRRQFHQRMMIYIWTCYWQKWMKQALYLLYLLPRSVTKKGCTLMSSPRSRLSWRFWPTTWWNNHW